MSTTLIADTVDAPEQTTPRRLRSLDVLRGGTVAAMVVVNNQGHGSHPFWGMSHASWNGFTFADLVFPAFLVIVGISMAFSFAAARDRGATRGELLRKATRRGLLLVVIGLALHGFPRADLAELRIPGVLQRIGVASVLAAAVVLYVRPRRQVLLAAAILAGYAAVLAFVPVPGLGRPLLTAHASVPGWVDQHLFGVRHVYRNGGYDPEGLLGTISAVVSVLAGFWAGEVLRRAPWRRACRQLTIGGTAAVALGLAWGALLPLNKRLWTPPFVLLTAGLTVLLLVVAYAVVDVRGTPRLTRAMEPLGRNAILVYVGSEQLAHVLKTTHLGSSSLREVGYADVFRPAFGFNVGSLAYGLAIASVFWIIAEAMHRRGRYLKI